MASGAFGVGMQAVGSISGFLAKKKTYNPSSVLCLTWVPKLVSYCRNSSWHGPCFDPLSSRYTAGKMHLFDGNGHTFKSFIFISPLMGTMLIVISCMMDYRCASLLRPHS